MTTPKALLITLSLLALSVPASAQTGLLVVAHGAGPEWNQPVREVVAEVRWSRGPVAVAFLMGPEAVSSGWDSSVARLLLDGARDIVVVPLLVSSFGEHYEQIRYLAGEITELPAALAQHQHGTRRGAGVPMLVAAALDDAPELAEALAIRWTALSERDRSRAALLLAHGPSNEADVSRWHERLGNVGRTLGERGGPRELRVALLRDDAPAPVRAAAVGAMRDSVLALAARSGDSVVVLPVLISSGAITAVRIPADLEGLPVRYVRLPLAPLPPLARWIASSAARRLAVGTR